MLAHDAAERAAGGGVELFGHAAGEVGEPPGLDRQLRGHGHGDGVFGGGDGRVHEHAVVAEFHGDRGVGGGDYPAM
jgi:hypothetical protein